MKVRLKVKPGQRGTLGLLQEYGDKLVCVRYRYDEESATRYTTVELIVAKKPWRPSRLKPDDIVSVRVGFGEVALRQKVKDAGGRWDSRKKVWEMPFKIAIRLGLRKRILGEGEEEEG